MENFDWRNLESYWPIIISFGTALAILIAGWIASKWVNRLVLKGFRARKMDEALGRFLGSMAKYAVLAAAVISALGRIGVEAASLITIFATAGLAVGLALQGSLSNFASGVMILLFRPFDIGDKVEVAGATGNIKDIGIMATTILTLDNHRIIIPNSNVMSGNITNYTAEGQIRGAVGVGVAYGSDVVQVQDVLVKAAKSVGLVLDDPAPVIAFVGLGASSLDFDVLVWSKPDDYIDMLAAVRTAVYDHLNDAGIEIPFNQLVVHKAEA